MPNPELSRPARLRFKDRSYALDADERQAFRGLEVTATASTDRAQYYANIEDAIARMGTAELLEQALKIIDALERRGTRLPRMKAIFQELSERANEQLAG